MPHTYLPQGNYFFEGTIDCQMFVAIACTSSAARWKTPGALTSVSAVKSGLLPWDSVESSALCFQKENDQYLSLFHTTMMQQAFTPPRRWTHTHTHNLFIFSLYVAVQDFAQHSPIMHHPLTSSTVFSNTGWQSKHIFFTRTRCDFMCQDYLLVTNKWTLHLT